MAELFEEIASKQLLLQCVQNSSLDVSVIVARVLLMGFAVVALAAALARSAR